MRFVSDLTAFLLDRITEDEEVARTARVNAGHWHQDPECPDVVLAAGDDFVGDVAGPHIVAHIARHDPHRVLAECAAKRRIVELHWESNARGWRAGGAPMPSRCAECRAVPFPCPTLRALASVYADHPDYDPGWAV